MKWKMVPKMPAACTNTDFNTAYMYNTFCKKRNLIIIGGSPVAVVACREHFRYHFPFHGSVWLRFQS